MYALCRKAYVLTLFLLAMSCASSTLDNISSATAVSRLQDSHREDANANANANAKHSVSEVAIQSESLLQAQLQAHSTAEEEEIETLPSDYFDEAFSSSSSRSKSRSSSRSSRSSSSSSSSTLRGADSTDEAVGDRSYMYDEDTDAAYDIYHATRMSNLASKVTYHTGELMRKLVGSNCVEIERGTVTKYYMCVGCVIESAMGCVNDMRQNKSGNVGGGCKFDQVFEGNMDRPLEQWQALQCCPKVTSDTKKLYYSGSAYPEAIRCIENAGCKESTIYSQLVDECEGMCSYVPENAGSTFWADRNGWRRGRKVRRGLADEHEDSPESDMNVDTAVTDEATVSYPSSSHHQRQLQGDELALGGCFAVFAAAPRQVHFHSAAGVVLMVLTTLAVCVG